VAENDRRTRPVALHYGDVATADDEESLR